MHAEATARESLLGEPDEAVMEQPIAEHTHRQSLWLAEMTHWQWILFRGAFMLLIAGLFVIIGIGEGYSTQHEMISPLTNGTLLAYRASELVKQGGQWCAPDSEHLCSENASAIYYYRKLKYTGQYQPPSGVLATGDLWRCNLDLMTGTQIAQMDQLPMDMAWRRVIDSHFSCSAMDSSCLLYAQDSGVMRFVGTRLGQWDHDSGSKDEQKYWAMTVYLFDPYEYNIPDAHISCTNVTPAIMSTYVVLMSCCCVITIAFTFFISYVCIKGAMNTTATPVQTLNRHMALLTILFTINACASLIAPGLIIKSVHQGLLKVTWVLSWYGAQICTLHVPGVTNYLHRNC